MSIPEDKTAADRAAEEEKMEIERGIRLLDASTDDISTQDGKRSRVDSLSSHFIRVCGLGQSEVFEASDSYHPPPPHHGAAVFRNHRPPAFIPHG